MEKHTTTSTVTVTEQQSGPLTEGKSPETIQSTFTTPENRKKYHKLLQNTMAKLDDDFEALRQEMGK